MGQFPSHFVNIDDIYVFNITSLFLEKYKYLLQLYDAFSGYLYFEKWDNSCPFESMSRGTPYLFADETEIIFIQSEYGNITAYDDTLVNSVSTNTCKWKFLAPNGYGFKIVILSFNISETSHFQVLNTTDLLVK